MVCICAYPSLVSELSLVTGGKTPEKFMSSHSLSHLCAQETASRINMATQDPNADVAACGQFGQAKDFRAF